MNSVNAPFPGSGAAHSGAAGMDDARLQALRDRYGNGTSNSDSDAVAAVAKEFEGVLLKQLVSAMQQTISVAGSEGGLFGQGNMPGKQMLSHLVEQSLADHLAASGGIGMADTITASLSPTVNAPSQGRVSQLPPPSDAQAPTISSGSQGHPPTVEGPPPLSGQLPPQDDAWLGSPRARRFLIDKLLRGGGQ